MGSAIVQTRSQAWSAAHRLSLLLWGMSAANSLSSFLLLIWPKLETQPPLPNVLGTHLIRLHRILHSPVCGGHRFQFTLFETSSSCPGMVFFLQIHSPLWSREGLDRCNQMGSWVWASPVTPSCAFMSNQLFKVKLKIYWLHVYGLE